MAEPSQTKISGTTFKGGSWAWDEIGNGLIYVTRDMHLKVPSATTTNISVGSKQTVQTDFKFKETVDNLEQIKFRRHCQRKCKPNEPEVVTIQDVKDVVFFITDPKQLSTEFIRYFHLPTMDRFLRALIVYFQYYLQVWDVMMLRREEQTRKLRQPAVLLVENRIRDDLADLRSMVSREYCSILIGADDTKKFHHMSNRNNDSLSGKDKRLFETLVCLAVRVVWVALQRKYLSLIELELNRMLRTEHFNLIMHRGNRSAGIFMKTPEEERVLTGRAEKDERKLLKRSPVASEILFADHDYRFLAIGIRDSEPKDERIDYLEAAYAAPEELLVSLGVTVGILGMPRNDLDAMLQQKERTTKSVKPAKELPEFRMPPVIHHRDEEIPKTFPNKPCKWKESPQSIAARKSQAKLWQSYLTTVTELSDAHSLSAYTHQSL